jgi:predicted site-specific integrase-resolvase
MAIATPPAYGSPADLARILTERGLAVSDGAVREWIRRGQLKAVRLPSGQTRTNLSVADELIPEQQVA